MLSSVVFWLTRIANLFNEFLIYYQKNPADNNCRLNIQRPSDSKKTF